MLLRVQYGGPGANRTRPWFPSFYGSAPQVRFFHEICPIYGSASPYFLIISLWFQSCPNITLVSNSQFRKNTEYKKFILILLCYTKSFHFLLVHNYEFRSLLVFCLIYLIVYDQKENFIPDFLLRPIAQQQGT